MSICYNDESGQFEVYQGNEVLSFPTYQLAYDYVMCL